MVLALTKERKIELAAVFIMVLWVAAWLGSLAAGHEIPQALNVVMPMAAAALLGMQLPLNSQKKEKK